MATKNHQSGADAGSGRLHASPTALDADARRTVGRALDALLVDGLDLYSHVKLAHWNIKGPHFASLHPLLDQIAEAIQGHTDTIAERAVTLGLVVRGTARQVASASRIEEYPADTTRDLEHVEHLAARLNTFGREVRSARGTADELRDVDTSDLLTSVLEDVDKYGWFLLATLGR